MQVGDYQMRETLELYVYAHHALSMISLQHGWRKFVFGLFRDIRWTRELWSVFDSVGVESDANCSFLAQKPSKSITTFLYHTDVCLEQTIFILNGD